MSMVYYIEKGNNTNYNVTKELILMSNELNELQEWLNQLSNFELPSWQELPDIYLYMDQVLTYIDKELKPCIVDEQDKLTGSMINNYVKGGVIPSPNAKKYSRSHIAYLLAINSLKQVLSITDIKTILSNKVNDQEDYVKAAYGTYKDVQKNKITGIVNEVSSELEDYVKLNSYDEQRKELYQLVLKLAIDAEVKKMVADKILNSISIIEKNETITAEKNKKIQEEMRKQTEIQLAIDKKKKEEKKKKAENKKREKKRQEEANQKEEIRRAKKLKLEVE